MLALYFAFALAVADDALMPVFQIDIHIADRESSKSSAPLNSPKIVVHNGRQATLRHGIERAYVTGVKDVPGGQEPVIQVVNEGVSVLATPTKVDGDEVSLELVIQNAKVTSVDERPIGDDGSLLQSPTVESVEVRTTKVVRLGKQVVVNCGDRCLTFVVHRFKDDRPGKAPLNAVDAPSPHPLR